MKVAIVHSFYASDQPSGENQAVQAQIHALAQAGHDVMLLARHTDAESLKCGYPIRAAFRTASGRGANPRDSLAAFEPDVIHVHNTFPNWSVKWIDEWRSRTVLTLHNYRPYCAAATFFRDGHDCRLCAEGNSVHSLKYACYRGSRLQTLPLTLATRKGGSYRQALQSVAAVVTLNKEALQLVNAARSSGRVYLVPNFVEVEPRSLSRKDGAYLYVGRLTEEKGLRRLIADWPRQRRLSIIGSGPLEAEISEAATREPETFHYAGRLEHPHVLDAIASARALVLPSVWSEGIPTVCLESLASGTPLVISDRCSSAADLSEGGAGEVYSPSDVGSLDQAINSMESRWAAASSAAKATHRRRYSRARWLDETTKIYTQLAAPSDQTSRPQ